MSQTTYSLQLGDSAQQNDVRKQLEGLGLVEDLNPGSYTVWRFKGEGVVAILYTSGKLVLQGLNASSVMQKLNMNTMESSEFVAHIGVDEVGKGDYFGPLVVVAAFASKDDSEKLVSLGVGDSKKLSEGKILSIGEELSKSLLHKEIIVSPSEYAQLNKELGNVSIMLAKQHAKAVDLLNRMLVEKGITCNEVVFDQFSKRKDRLINELKAAGVTMNISQFHKGESDIVVAAASILARYYFLEEWEKMEKEYSFEFPKGSSEVIDSAKDFVKQFGAEELGKVAKVSFKTTQKVLQLF